jgi:tRNA threonylcarbamoyl adenosine modification protein YeaZ
LRPDPLILAFDTSAAHCAAALLRGDRVLAARDEAMDKGQAERLMPMLQDMLAGAGFGLRDLDALAAGTGPGNFTGVRLSVAAARGLSLSLGIPAVGVTTLDAAAFGLPRPVLAALDARRDSVYLQLFGPDTPPPAALASLDALPAWAFGAAAVAGDAAERTAGVLDRPVAPQPMAPAVAMGRLAAARLAESAGTIPRPAPLYLRPADAAPPRDPPPEIIP